MPRGPRDTAKLDLPPEPDPDLMPIVYGDKFQLAEIHGRYFGPVSHRSLERWPLVWRRVNGRNIGLVRDFLKEAKRRFDSAPEIKGGSGAASAPAAKSAGRKRPPKTQTAAETRHNSL